MDAHVITAIKGVHGHVEERAVDPGHRAGRSMNEVEHSFTQAGGHGDRLSSGHKGQGFSVPEFKDWTGVSRKYAIPLLEYLDRERITRRDDDLRTVL